MDLRICIDVSDLAKAIAFYRDALGLQLGRRLGEQWAEMLGAPAPIDLIAHPAGTSPAPKSSARRDYARHWTPVHLDFVVTDLEAAVQRAKSAGAALDHDIAQKPWGRIAVLADPFGNGFCLLQMSDRGYDALFEG